MFEYLRCVNGWENILLRRVLLLNTAPFVVRGTGVVAVAGDCRRVIVYFYCNGIFPAVLPMAQSASGFLSYIGYEHSYCKQRSIMNRKVSTTSLDFFLF